MLAVTGAGSLLARRNTRRATRVDICSQRQYQVSNYLFVFLISSLSLGFGLMCWALAWLLSFLFGVREFNDTGNDDDNLVAELSKAKKTNVGVLENFHFRRIVPTMLDFSNVGTVQHELAETRLANATTNGLGESAIEQHLMPDQLLALGATAQVELGFQDLGVDADTHGGKFKGHFQE